MKTHIFLITGLLLASTAVYSGDIKATRAIDPQAAFARLKTLAGEWQASDGKEKLSYEVIGGGSALVERETSAAMPAMQTVYHLDGDRLMLTHYCMAGNQPRMVAQSFNAATGELQFRFLDATNLVDSNAGHMHNVTLKFIDDDHVKADWEFYKDGRRTTTESFEYARVR